MGAVVFATQSLLPFQIVLPTGTLAGAYTDLGILEIRGLRDLDGLRTDDEPRGQADGLQPGMNRLGNRVVTIKWELTLATGGVEAALQLLAAAYQNVPDPDDVVLTGGEFLRQMAGVGDPSKPVSALYVQLPGRTLPLVVFGRPLKYTPPIDRDYQWGQVVVGTQWDSPDGLLYDGTVISDTVGLPASSGGLAWPAAFPWAFGDSSGGAVNLFNSGEYPARPLTVLRGPVNWPTVANANTGEYIRLNMALGVDDTVVIDHDAGTVTLNGSGNRNGKVAQGSTFFTCRPGMTTIAFSSTDAVTPAGTMSVYIMPTYSSV